jgi:hypothetical protein
MPSSRPIVTATAFGLLLIAGHNLLDSVSATGPLWSILHRPGFVLNTPDHVVFVANGFVGMTSRAREAGEEASEAPGVDRRHQRAER